MVFGSNVNMDCIEKVLKPVKRVERKGLQDLLYEDEEQLVKFWNNLEEAREFYEENDSCGADSDMHKDIESRFSLARLKVATSLNDLGSFPNITKKFNETELDLFHIIEEFAFFDGYSIEEIRKKIQRQEGQVFSMVKKYSKKIQSDTDTIFEDPKIKRGIARGIKIMLKERSGKIEEGVIEYIRINGHIKTFNEVEDAVTILIKSREKRGEISAEVQARLDDLEKELAAAKDTASRKDQLENQMLEMERTLIQKDFESSSLKDRISILEAEKENIASSYGSLDNLLKERIREVGDKKKELEEKEDSIQKARDNLSEDMKKENQRLLQEELEKIEEMKRDIRKQANEIEVEKESLRFQKEELDDKFNAIKEAIEGGASGKRFVPKDLAKLYEMDHIGRFEMKMNEFPIKVTNPINSKTYTVSSWGDNHIKMDEKDYLYSQFRDDLTLSDIETQLPLNVRSRYEVKERKFSVFGKKEPRIIIESMVLGHLKEYAANGFDTRPVTLSELNGILVRLINNAEKGQYFHVMAIASTTGWDERIRTYVLSDEFARNYVSRYVSLCLVDLETGELIYNEADSRIREYVPLFEPRFDVEKVNECKKYIRQEHWNDDYVVLDDIVNFSQIIVRKAFNELEKEGFGKVMYVDEVGLVLKLI